jgi:hypothetical protein
VLGWLFLDEPFRGRTLVAGAIILAAFAVMGAASSRGAAPEAASPQ